MEYKHCADVRHITERRSWYRSSPCLFIRLSDCCWMLCGGGGARGDHWRELPECLSAQDTFGFKQTTHGIVTVSLVRCWYVHAVGLVVGDSGGEGRDGSVYIMQNVMNWMLNDGVTTNGIKCFILSTHTVNISLNNDSGLHSSIHHMLLVSSHIVLYNNIWTIRQIYCYRSNQGLDYMYAP